MATLSSLYPLLEKKGWKPDEAKEFIEIVEASNKEGVATKEDIAIVRGEINNLKYMIAVLVALNIAILIKLLI